MEHLVVKDFGPIKHIDIDIYPFTVFIGTQGSGKSTLSKLLTICRDFSWMIDVLNRTNEYAPFKKLCVDEYFTDNTYIYYVRDNPQVSLSYDNGVFSMNLENFSEEDTIKLLRTAIIKSNSELVSRLGVENLSIEEVNDNYSKLLRANARTLLYIPAERNMAGSLSSSLASMIVAQIPLYDALIEYMSIFERAKNYFKTYEVKFLNAKFEKANGVERIKLTDGSKETSLPLNACSSGLQSVLPLIMVISYSLSVKCFNSFVIEEPEQNLFPENQKELIQFLAMPYKKGVENLIITTHSPYILSVLNNLIYAYHVGQKKRDEVSNVIPVDCWIPADEVSAYFIHDGNAESIIDEELHQIKAEMIDSISAELNKQYDQLLNIEYDERA